MTYKKTRETQQQAERTRREIVTVNKLFSEIPIGSVLVYAEGVKQIVSKKLDDYDAPKETIIEAKHQGIELVFEDVEIQYQSYVDIEDIMEYGFEKAFNTRIYKINLDYVDKHKRIVESKTIKELKEVLLDVIK